MWVSHPHKLSMEEPILHLTEDETAIVGYGSLLSIESVSRTLKREYDGPFVACHVAGWRRSWDAWMPNASFYFVEGGERIYPNKIAYLNVRPNPGTLMNCILFVVRDVELEAMHQREWIYAPTDVSLDLHGVRLDAGKAIMYVAKNEHRLIGATTRREAAVRQSYLRILERGLHQAAATFRAEYEATTDPVPTHLVIDDALDQDRPSPWAAAGSQYRPTS
jgi:hypothetical protein